MRLRRKENIPCSVGNNGWALVFREGVNARVGDKRLSSEVLEIAMIQRVIQRVIRSTARELVTPSSTPNLNLPDYWMKWQGMIAALIRARAAEDKLDIGALLTLIAL